MTVDNGPDRSLGLWARQGATPGRYKIENGECWYESNFSESGWEAGFSGAGSMLGDGLVPFDAIAKREAIRAGWREVDGEWVKDERGHLDYCGKCSSGYHCNQWHCPERFQVGAKRRGEWPQDEPMDEAPAPKSTKAPTAYRAAKAALREACDEARRQGQEDERRRQAARPCVLKRLQGVPAEAVWGDFSDEGTAAHLLLTVVEYAKVKGLDLSALAERLVGEVKP